MGTIKNLTLAGLIVACGACTSARTGKNAEQHTEKLTVASEMVDCVGVGVRRCLAVKPEGVYDWELFYNWIEGFEYEPGYEYVISVYKFPVAVPPADGSSLKYVLDRVISRQKKDSENLPDTSYLIEALRQEGLD